MTLSSIARRYAAALFDVTKKAGLTDEAGRELSAIAALLTGHDELRRVVETPAVPADRKKAIVEALLTPGRASDAVRRMFVMLAERDRLTLAPAIATAFEAKRLAEQRVVRAEVVTAAPLAEPTRAALARALSRVTGADVTITTRQDPEILGGVIATVGSVVYDGSVTGQLQRLRQKLVAEA